MGEIPCNCELDHTAPGQPEGAFEEWRHQRDFTRQKYASWERGDRPSHRPSSIMRCPRGEMFNSHRLEHTLIHVSHITATVDSSVLAYCRLR
jgi:hypothetical protein